MPYTLTELEREIVAKIELEKASGNQEIVADWVAHSVMAEHREIVGDDSEFHTCCSYRTVRETTRKVMSAYQKGEVKDASQTTLDGFEYLQTHYVITRDIGKHAQQMMVAITALTYDELTVKAGEHYAMQKAHGKHGDEIIRFRDDKFRFLAA